MVSYSRNRSRRVCVWGGGEIYEKEEDFKGR